MPLPRPVRDVGWGVLGLAGALGAMRAVEAMRPDVVGDAPGGADGSDERADPFRRELPVAYAISGVAILVGPLLGGAPLPAVCAPLGLGVQAAGVGLRLAAMRELRGHYARTLRVVDAQPVVRTGPYRAVRHPGYLGSLLIWVGAALAARNGAAVALTVTAVGTAYQHRMDAEDLLLRRDLPGYVEYAATTPRLVPAIGRSSPSRCHTGRPAGVPWASPSSDARRRPPCPVPSAFPAPRSPARPVP